MNILNLCDINDESKNIYYEELLKYYSKDQIYSRGYDLKEHPGELLFNLISAKYDLIVGHGFGGLLALIIGRATGAKTILINPMYPASRYWPDIIPDYEYKSFIVNITEKQICWDTHGETTENVYLILGKEDDLIDTATTDKYLTRGNSFYVEGGHWPSGEDFVLKFGELTGGLITSGDGLYIEREAKEQRSLDDLKMLLKEKDEYKLMYLYAYNKENCDRLTETAKRYLSSLNFAAMDYLYVTADSLHIEETEARRCFKHLDFLIIDKIVGRVLSDEIRRSLWIACDEVTGHGGKVLLLSDSHATDLFEEDKELMDLIYTGYITELYFDDKTGSIGCFGRRSDDTRPFEDYYRVVIIDDIKTKYGNLAIKWHSPDLEARWFYLYYKDEQWFYDSSDGWCSVSQAKAVLSAAVDKFVEGAKDTDHDAHHFFGWGW